MKQLAVVTIVSNNYLHYARTLLQSVAAQHPDAARYCVIVDRDLGPARELAAEFDVLELGQIGLPFGDEFLFQYTVLELNTAVKPWAMQHLLDRGHTQVLYIDPDIYLYRPLTHVTGLLDQGASVVLTPHLLAPMTDDRKPGELEIRMSGTYNCGFCAVGEHPEARKFLTWWQGKLARDCVNDTYNGVFVDQSWVDLAPTLFAGVEILRHNGYNAAYWNLAQRPVARDGDGWTTAGEPLHFFHFSGIDPENPGNLSKHQNRYTLASAGALVKQLFEEYCRTVVGNGISRYRPLPYGFGKFDDGTPIPAATRERYRTSAELRAKAGPKPFASKLLAHGEQADVDPVATERLRRTYMYFLARQPDPSALQHMRDRCATIAGWMRVAAGIGRSPEARAKAGWQARLLFWPFLQLPLGAAPNAVLASAPAPELPRPPKPAPSGKPSEGAPGINLAGYIAAELGVGEGARALARACHAAGVPYSVIDVGYQTPNLQRDKSALAHAVERRFPIDLVYVNADQTPRTAAFLKKEGVNGAYKIGYWAWEQPKFPAMYFEAFAHVNEIWVPSRFVQDAIGAVSPVPVYVIPHSISITVSENVSRAQFGLPENKLLVLMMYDFHSYQHRKNPQAAIEAFRKAAAGRSDCALVVKTINGDAHPDAYAQLRAHLADLQDVTFIDGYLTRQETWDLQASCDILLSLHRAEGFGLAPAEMMFLGKPVVATGWSANMDFMNHDNSMPIEFTLQPLLEDLGAYPAGPLWAEADTGHAAQCLTRLFDDAQLRARIGERAAQDVRAQLSPATVGALVRERLQALAYWHPELRG